MFLPMTSYLSAELGRQVRLVTEKNFTSFWERVKNREFDLVHFGLCNEIFVLLAKRDRSRLVISGLLQQSLHPFNFRDPRRSSRRPR